MMTHWERRPLGYWRHQWQVPELNIYDDVSSTSDVARDRAAAGAPAGTLVIADHQSAGRGRQGRQWLAAPHASLLASFVLRPRPSLAPAPGTAPLRIGMAVANALRQRFHIDAHLKWPNDVVVPLAGKLAGILCEASSAGDEVTIIAGIGINVRQQPQDWPPELRAEATSIAALSSHDRVGPAHIMTALAPLLRPLFTAPLEPLTIVELQEYLSLDVLAGRHIIATTGTETVTGMAAGVASDGALLIDANGRVRRLTSATVRFAAQSSRSHSA